MNKDEKELLEKFRGLTLTNQAIALSNMRVAYATQENTLKGTKRTKTPEPPKSRQRSA